MRLIRIKRNWTTRPRMSGITNNSTTVLRISRNSSSKDFKYKLVSANACAQNSKFKGVNMGVISVARPVSETESATFAPEIEDIKLEMFPPGQEATNIIPNANAGGGFKIQTRRNVKNGSNKNWEITPTEALLGRFTTSLKSLGFMPKAIPNMIKPKHILSKMRLSSENLTAMSGRVLSIKI